MADHSDPSRQVAETVFSWIVDTETLLAQAQTALEKLRYRDGIPPDVETTIYQLLVLLRQRRAQTPTADVVRVWARSLIQHFSPPPPGAASSQVNGK